MKELEFIKYLTKKFPTKKPVLKGIGDDCAILEYKKDRDLLLTCDMIIEGVHFSKDVSAFKIGWKAVAVNISDIAAMGGVPKYVLISIGLSHKKNPKFLKGVTKGIESICKKFNISLIGGDTNRSDKTVINVTLIGDVEKKCLIKRSGAKEGDLIFVTGELGLGPSKHLRFMPRLKEARILTKDYNIHAMIDLSDGLSMDLLRLTNESKVGARIYKSLIPLSQKSVPLKKAVNSGEDFELLFTASTKESIKIIKRMGKKEDLPLTLIGEITNKRLGVKLVEEEGKLSTIKPKGFAHL